MIRVKKVFSVLLALALVFALLPAGAAYAADDEGKTSYTVSFDTDTDVRRGVFKALARADCPILSMTTGGLTLEESFLKLTEGGDD